MDVLKFWKNIEILKISSGTCRLLYEKEKTTTIQKPLSQWQQHRRYLDFFKKNKQKMKKAHLYEKADEET